MTVDLVPDWAEITLTTDPDDAVITVNGQPIERKQSAVAVPSGEQVITVSAPGFESTKVELLVEANTPQDLGLIALTPADGILTLESNPSGASVTQNGRYVGITPLQVALTPNQNHQIVSSKAGFERLRFATSLERAPAPRAQRP